MLEKYKQYVTVKSTGLDIKHGLPIEDWLEVGEQLKRVETGIQWWLGDWLNYGEREYGEKYSQALEVTDYSSGTLRNLAYVAGKIEMSRRHDNVSYSQHQEVASLEHDLQDKILNESENLTNSETRRLVQNTKHRQPPVLPRGEYNVIYADPPWRYQFSETNTREIENQYPTMELQDICDMKVPSAENSILLLWATAPKTEEALQVLNAWGFTYKTNMVWDKEKIGMGYWFRGQHELLLIGIKGEFTTPKESNRVSSVYREARTKHSSKPKHIYDLIESYFPNGKYLELFARDKHNDKWTCWGNERL